MTAEQTSVGTCALCGGPVTDDQPYARGSATDEWDVVHLEDRDCVAARVEAAENRPPFQWPCRRRVAHKAHPDTSVVDVPNIAGMHVTSTSPYTCPGVPAHPATMAGGSHPETAPELGHHVFEAYDGASGYACTAMVLRDGHGTDCGLPADHPVHQTGGRR